MALNFIFKKVLPGSVQWHIVRREVEPELNKAKAEIELLKEEDAKLFAKIPKLFKNEIPALLEAKISLTNAALAKLEADKKQAPKAEKALAEAKEEMTDAINALVKILGKEGFQRVLKMLPLKLARSANPKILVADQIKTVADASPTMKERMIAGYEGVKPLLAKYHQLFNRIDGDLPTINISQEIIDGTTTMLLGTLGADLIVELKELMALEKAKEAKAGKPITHAKDAKATSAKRKKPAAVSDSEPEEDEEAEVDLGDSWGSDVDEEEPEEKPKAKAKRAKK